VRDSERDAGLLRAVGPTALAASLIGQLVGAGIFALPAALAANLGVYAPLAILGCGLAVGTVAICFAEGGSRVPTSGGAYGYIEVAFGPLVGYVAGTWLWVGNVLACAGVVAALADVVTSVLPPALRTAGRAASIVGALGALAAVNVAGVAHAARLVKLTTVAKLLPLAVFIVAGVGALRIANFSQAMLPEGGSIGRAVILALFAYLGMEVSLSASGEVAQPNRTIPRAVMVTMLSVMGLYLAIQLIAQGILGASLAHSSVPLADAMGHISPTLRGLMYAFARDGLLPRVLGRIHDRSHAPYVAILCYAAIAAALALSGSFAALATLAALNTAAVYVLACAAAWRLARRGIALAGAPLQFPLLGLSATVGMSSMLVVIALASRQEILGVAALGIASALVYLMQMRTAVLPGRTP
jgi:basic amino acid/polyamine antiporter, APA family